MEPYGQISNEIELLNPSLEARNEGSGNGNAESRSYLEKKLVFCFGSHIAAQMLLHFGEENLLSSSELTQAQEVNFILCFLLFNGINVKQKIILEDMQCIIISLIPFTFL
ncbi:hypothetical protein RchiOBHm_Chr4g0396731 [Rosa chinensis]|uniref:Uncharacterized protein n=1 Tax=Rosa chinensis TaxID=74649 RepID=A0A2P6QRV7_ROSCH|nr:hypothetical protein RchiOBHm_Chr4g0396731 [Rosa chinensis]